MRRGSAQSLVEVTVGIVLFVPIFLLLLDLSVILWAVQQNEALCRNAVQAAASGAPAEAKARAQGVVDRQMRTNAGGFVSQFRLIEPVETHVTSAPQSERDLISENLINRGGPITGTATVVTEVDVKPFVVQAIYTGKSPLKFRSTQSFPLTYVMPASTQVPEI